MSHLAAPGHVSFPAQRFILLSTTMLIEAIVLGVVCSLGLGLLVSIAFFVRQGKWQRVGLALVAVAVLVPFGLWLLTVQVWIGRKTTDLQITVIEDDSGKPIPNASVKVFDPMVSGQETTGITNNVGLTVLKHTFSAYGRDGVFSKSGNVRLLGNFVNVDAAGYEPLQTHLEDQVGFTWDLYGLPIEPIIIRMTRKAVNVPVIRQSATR